MYNLEYYEKMLRLYSKTAEDICKLRWDFIKELKPKTVLDYGCGIGWFRAYKPERVEVDTYDIADYPQTGITRDEYDVMCMWDVLEHLPSFKSVEGLFKSVKYVALTIPIAPKGQDLSRWKHYKPGEHLHYFTEDTLDLFFKSYSFEKVKSNYNECPPRKDVLSAIYENKEA